MITSVYSSRATELELKKIETIQRRNEENIMLHINKLLKWAIPALFMVVLLINYFTAVGIILPATQSEISNHYQNLFAPAGFTFSIWAVIYIGVLASLTLGFSTSSKQANLNKGYQQLVQPIYIEWMFYNLLWTIAWSNDQILIALIAMVLYARRMLQLMILISGTASLRTSPWLLKYPVGLHVGWLIVATFANLTTYAVSIGIDGTGTVGFWWAIGMMLASLSTVVYFYSKYGNEAIVLPALWALVGIIVKHNPGSAYEYANETLSWIAVGLFLIGTSVYGYLFKLQIKQNKK